MIRREDWPEQLAAYIENTWKSGVQHQYGTMDCCLYVAGAIQAMVGTAPAENIHGTYSDAAGARGALESQGWAGIEAMLEALAAQFGWTEVGPNYVQRGDVLFIKAETLGIPNTFDGVPAIWSGSFATFFLVHGWAYTARGTVARAWRID